MQERVHQGHGVKIRSRIQGLLREESGAQRGLVQGHTGALAY